MKQLYPKCHNDCKSKNFDNMKRIVLTLVALFALSCGAVAQQASPVVIDGFEYTISRDRIWPLRNIVALTGVSDDIRQISGELVIPSVVTIDGQYFEVTEVYDCSQLQCKSIILPYTLEVVGPLCFYGCANLESVTFPLSTLSIGYAAMESCTNLRSVTFEGLKLSVSDMLRKCTNLEEIIIKEYDPPYILDNGVDGPAFHAITWNAENVDLYVPDAVVDKYAANGFWCDFKSIRPLSQAGRAEPLPAPVCAITCDSATGIVTVPEGSSTVIYNSKGQPVISGRLASYDISALQPGTYLIRSDSETLKIIK